MNLKLTIELVPQTCWYSNVRSNVTTKEWDLIRKESYAKAGYQCEICKEKGPTHPVECHEIWEYDDKNHTQKLIGFISLCPNCHKVKHPGLAQMRGEYEIVITQLMKVNGMTREEARKYAEDCFEIWERRSTYDWKLDITLIKPENKV